MSSRYRTACVVAGTAAVMIAALANASAQQSQPTNAGARPDSTCNTAAPEAIVHVALPAAPIWSLSTRDGCSIFVKTLQGLSVLSRRGGAVALTASWPRPTTTSAQGIDRLDGLGGMTLTRDEKMLVVRVAGRLVFLDTTKLLAGDPAPTLGVLESPRFGLAMSFGPGLLVTPDDKYLIVTQHTTAWMGVIDLNKVRANGPTTAAIVAESMTADYPTTLWLSPDERWLFLAHGRSDDRRSDPAVCHHSFGANSTIPTFGRAAISVFAMDKFPALSKSVTEFLTGCEATTMALSPDGKTVYSAPHGDDMLLAFDTSAIGPGVEPRVIGRVPLNSGPRDIAVVDGGKTLIVGHGYEVAPAGQPTSLVVIDASRVAEGAAAIRGIIPTRSGGVSLSVTADQRTLLVPNREAQTMQLVDLTRLPLQPAPKFSQAR